MGTRILVVIVVIALCFGGYYVYEHQKDQKQMESGAFQCVGCDSPEQHARFLKENSGETADNESEHKNLSARQSAANAAAEDATAGTAGYNSVNRDTPGAASSPVNGNGMQNGAQQQPMMAPVAVQSNMPVSAAMPPPAYDSQSVNNANGMKFGSSANYSWYRQGSITYRVDSVTGRSCIAYATMEEWRKQVVMSHGCGRSS